MSRFLFPIALLAVAGGVTWQFPLFHLVPLKEVEAKKQAKRFGAAEYAAKFWDERLTPALAEAADAMRVLAALDVDHVAARKEFGRTVGLSRATFFFVRGRGTIVAVEKSRIGLALGRAPDKPDLWLLTGPIVGNAVRDAPGLLKSQDFPNSQHFNELAAELNSLVERRVLPRLRDSATTGQQIEFNACVEIAGGRVRQPLEFTPLAATVK
jgi:predicted lipoprotein